MPASGTTGDAPQTVTVDCVGDGLTAKLYRGAIVFRTDRGLNVTLLTDVTISP